MSAGRATDGRDDEERRIQAGTNRCRVKKAASENGEAKIVGSEGRAANDQNLHIDERVDERPTVGFIHPYIHSFREQSRKTKSKQKAKNIEGRRLTRV